MNLTYCKNLWVVPLLVVGVFVASAFLFLSFAQAAEEADIQAAIQDLSSATGQSIASEDQAKDLCNQEQYLDICADIGKEHDLYTEDEIGQVDAFLNEIKGQVLADIKACQDEECLIRVASQLAQKVQTSNPTLATNLKLTTAIVEQKNSVVQAAKEVGVSFRDCEAMNPDTAPVELLRKCAKLAKDQRVQNYIPEEKRALAAQFEDSAMIKLREALAAGTYQCGDGTLDGCGNYCLNPTGTAGIPAVCAQIASEIFGQDGVKQLEAAHKQVGQVKDYYSKKFVLTLPDGSEVVGDRQIRARCDRAFSNRNLEVARTCGNFAVKNGFASQAEVDKGLKLMDSFAQKGQNVSFDDCLADPVSCRDFLPEDEIGRFDAGRQIFEIMRAEIGFDPQQCERGTVDEAIGVKCFEGSKRALVKIEGLGLAGQSREVRFIIEDITRHVAEGDNLTQRKDQFRKVFSQQGGPGGCRSEQECFNYCSDPANGPECISFGAQQGVSGFRGEEAVQRFNEYNQNIQEQHFQFSGQGPYPGFQLGEQPGQVPGFTQPGPGFSPPPGTGYYPPYPGPGPVGSSPPPECFAAIQSGDFAKAKTFCYVPPQSPRLPTPNICPLSPYVECPAGQYRESHQNRDGCWIDGPCQSAPTYSPGPYPTYSPGPYPTGPYPSPGPGEKSQCYDGIDNDNDGKTDYPADSSCYGPDDQDEYYPPDGGPYPTYSPGSTSWVNKTWKFKDGSTQSSSILNKTDSEYTTFISGVYNDCLNKYFAGWMPGGGDQSNWREFGVPKCTATAPSPGVSPYPTYSPYPTGSPGGKPQCSDGIDNDGDGKTDYPADSSCYGADDWDEYYPPVGTSVSPYPSPSPSSCPTGYHYHGDSGGFCMNDQENYGGTCYNSAGTSKITCPAQPTYSPYPTSSPGSSSCSQSLINLLGSGCHWMYSDSSGRGIYCDGPMTKSAKEGDIATTAGCSGGGGTYSPYPTYSPPPGTSYTPTPSCPSGQYWDYPSNSCKSNTSYGGCTGTTQSSCTSVSNCYWEPSSNYCYYQSTSPGTTYTPYPTCPSGQWWDPAISACKSTSPSDTPPPGTGYCGNYVCDSGETSSSCPADCGGGTTYTPYPICSSGQYWDSAASSCVSSTTTTYAPPPPSTSDPATECANSGGSWNGSTCVFPTPPPTSGMYPYYMAMHCQQLGRTWNGETCQANGLFARFFEGSGMANVLRLFYIIP